MLEAIVEKTNPPVNEAEIQLLASMGKALAEGTPTDQSSLEKKSDRFWIYCKDWSDAYQSLIDRRYISSSEGGYSLTEKGRPLAEAYHRQRPDRYWYYYQKFYSAAHASAAHSKLCELVFGKDLCQEGMVDIAALDNMIVQLGIEASHHVLDLGCGVGVISEYISDTTGCQVTGLDYSESAIEIAKQRTADKADRLNFITADMNELNLKPNSFDIAISLDTFYWVEDLEQLLEKIAGTIKPDGQMGIFMLESSDTEKVLKADETEAGIALTNLGVKWASFDYSERNAEFWRKMYTTARDLLPEYEAEGNGFIALNLIKESEEDFLPFIESGTQVRFLFLVQV